MYHRLRNGSKNLTSNGDEVRRQLLTIIDQSARRDGRSLTVRELRQVAGLKSTSHVAHHLNTLVDQGYLVHVPGTARGYQLAQPPGVPVLGTIAAGIPLSIHEPDPHDTLDLGQHLREAERSRAEYALRVQGDSMIDDHIFDGDYVLVRPGNDAPDGAIVIAVHLLAGNGCGAATVKRFHRDRPRRVVRLEPANAAMAPITIPAAEWNSEWKVQGIVTGVYRPCLPAQKPRLSHLPLRRW